MIEGISTFCVSIICTIMLVIVLNMIMPDGKSKKYVGFVYKIVVTLVLIEPIIGLFDINIDEVLASISSDYEEVKVDENLYNEILKKAYEQELINDIVKRLNENGYSVNDVKIEYDKDSLMPTKLYMDLIGENGYVQPVKVEVSSISRNNEQEKELIKIKTILNENYGIKKENIFIN